MTVVVRGYLQRISGFHWCGDMAIAASVVDAGAPPTYDTQVCTQDVPRRHEKGLLEITRIVVVSRYLECIPGVNIWIHVGIVAGKLMKRVSQTQQELWPSADILSTPSGFMF